MKNLIRKPKIRLQMALKDTRPVLSNLIKVQPTNKFTMIISVLNKKKKL